MVRGIAQAALASYPALVREQLEIPDERAVICGISFGFEDPAHPVNRFRTGRAHIDDVLSWVE